MDETPNSTIDLTPKICHVCGMEITRTPEMDGIASFTITVSRDRWTKLDVYSKWAHQDCAPALLELNRLTPADREVRDQVPVYSVPVT
jgi:hypothetical protein